MNRRRRDNLTIPAIHYSVEKRDIDPHDVQVSEFGAKVAQKLIPQQNEFTELGEKDFMTNSLMLTQKVGESYTRNSESKLNR